MCRDELLRRGIPVPGGTDPPGAALFGKGATLILVPAWFGLAHYFGVPNGMTGVLLAGIGGWFFAKSMIETRGIAWAWFLHFLADFTVYLVLVLAPGGL